MIKGIKTAMVRIEGSSPFLMHSKNLVNPFNPYVREMKEITSKHHSKKTDTDLEKLMELEFQGGLYFDDEIGPYIPSEVLEGSIRTSARQKSKGKTIESGLQVTPDRVPLIYKGPRTREGLFEDKKFVDMRPVKLNKAASIIRTRGRFDVWSAEFEVMVFEDIVSVSDVRGYLEKAGMLAGIGDYRPKFGRYIVVDFEWV